MSRFRSIPLLLAATACLAVAGCGDDDPATTTSAAAPTTTAPATTTTAPATTTAPPATTETTPETTTKSDDSTPADSKADPLEKLKNYTKGGRTASDTEATEVRQAMREFSDAIADRDAKAICSRTIGIEELLSKSGQKGGNCETLFKGSSNAAAAPSKKDVESIAKGKVTIKGDRASLEITGGTPLPMRKVDGVWKVDYTAFATPGS